MRFIRGHALVNLLSLVGSSSDGLIIYLALVSTDLIGVGRQVGFSSLKFTPTLCLNWHLLNWGFFLTRCVVQHLGLL